MKNLFLVILLILISLILLISCSKALTQLSDADREKITTRIYDYSYDDVFSASLDRLGSRGFIIENVESKIGLITTDWKTSEDDVMTFLVGSRRAKGTVRVKKITDNKSKVILTIKSQLQNEFGGWDDITMTEDHKKEYDEYFKGIAGILEKK